MMSDKSQVPQGGSRRSSQSQESIDWKQCILCQSDDAKKGILVQNPRITSYEHVLEIVQERANLSDGDFVNVQRLLQNSTPQTLHAHGAVWHRSCHSNATNKDQIQRARDRILMQYVQATTLPRSVERREEAQSLLSQAVQHQILPHHSQGPERLH
ncbi:hypothetical protein ACOMHN_035623 [Nucella lapillus]